MKMLLICAGLATLVASPAFAQAGIGPFAPSSPYAAFGAVTPYGVSGSAQRAGVGSASRAAAIRRCSNASSQYKEYLWGNEEFEQYRACMAINGQPE